MRIRLLALLLAFASSVLAQPMSDRFSIGIGVNTALFNKDGEENLFIPIGVTLGLDYRITRDIHISTFLRSRFTRVRDSLYLEKTALKNEERVDLSTIGVMFGWRISDWESPWILIPEVGYGAHLFAELVDTDEDERDVSSLGHGVIVGFRLRYLMSSDSWWFDESYVQFSTHWNSMLFPEDFDFQPQTLDFALEYGIIF